MDSTTGTSRDSSDDKPYEYFAFSATARGHALGQVAPAANRDVSPPQRHQKQRRTFRSTFVPSFATRPTSVPDRFCKTFARSCRIPVF